LDGEQVDAGQELRVYAAAGNGASVLFLAFAPKNQLATFLPHVQAIIRSVRL
jgi:hypothetical protein